MRKMIIQNGSSIKVQNRLKHLKEVFHEKNDYPKWVINQGVEQVEAKYRNVTHSNNLPMDDFEQTFATN